jgi:CRISPR-associated protein Cmr2
MKYLVAIAIGPVQDFIAAARRCRDLWYGSQLLSELSKAAALSLQKHGATLIFPAPKSPDELAEDSPFTVVNKLLASVQTEHMDGLIAEVRQAVMDRLQVAADLREMKLRGLVVKDAQYRDQLRDLVEFNAAWVPEGEYKQSRSRVEELLAARKTLRNFQPYEAGAGEYKSSLDGAREHVIQKRSNRLYESNLKSNEYLDAVGIVKRFGKGSPRFDSTVDVAAGPYVQGVKKSSPRRQEAFRRYERFLRDQGLLPETYSLLYEHESRQLFDEDEAADAELKAIRKALGRPNAPYYALFLGDGDKIGGAISGLASADAHRDFSEALSGFAGQAQVLINSSEFGGCSIYCGGDDVLALLPLHTALACARKINKLFSDCMRQYNVSFSAGLVVTHGLEPLNEVRDWAKEAESTAKNAGGRNALCISIHPRSGAPIEVYGKWDDLCGLLQEIRDLGDQIPRGLAYEMRDLVERIADWPEASTALPQLVLAVAGKKKCSAEALKVITREVKDRTGIERLYLSLMVARWFARAQKEAEGDIANNLN